MNAKDMIEVLEFRTQSTKGTYVCELAMVDARAIVAKLQAAEDLADRLKEIEKRGPIAEAYLAYRQAGK